MLHFSKHENNGRKEEISKFLLSNYFALGPINYSEIIYQRIYKFVLPWQ